MTQRHDRIEEENDTMKSKDDFKREVVAYLRDVAKLYGVAEHSLGEAAEIVSHVLDVCAHDVETENFAHNGSLAGGSK